jgi:hypothetical protein
VDTIEKKARKFFGNEVTARDRAIFEGAITLGAIFHQFTGLPLKKSLIPIVQEFIEKTMSIQPFIQKVTVKINEKEVRNLEHSYDYSVLSGDLLELEVISQYENVRVHFGMKYVEELNYPLMFIKKIEKI